MFHKRFRTIVGPVRWLARPVAGFARRYPLLFVAVGFAIGVLAASLVVAHTIRGRANKAFSPEKVLPAPVTPPAAANTVFTADSLKQYDGQNGRDCYVAVKGTVYKLANQYWQNGKHTPSSGQAYCGADMSAVIGKSPHGESVLSSLPKVGSYKSQ